MKFPKKIARRQVTCSLTPGCKTQAFHTQLSLPSAHLSQHTSAHTHSFPTSASVVSCSALPFCVQGSPASPWAPSGPPAPGPPTPGSPWAPPSLSDPSTAGVQQNYTSTLPVVCFPTSFLRLCTSSWWQLIPPFIFLISTLLSPPFIQSNSVFKTASRE